MAKSIKKDIAHYLGHYVYALVDPRDGVPFYVGKGTTARVEKHGLEVAKLSEDHATEVEGRKRLIIREIRDAGLEVDVWILRRDMKAAEYSQVESAIIDLLRTFPIAPAERGDARRRPLHSGLPLTNLVRGSGADHGIVRLDDIIRDFEAPELATTTPLLLITLRDWVDCDEETPGGKRRPGYGFRPEWMDRELLSSDLELLGDSVRCWWNLDPDRVEREGVKHLVALYDGVTRGLFEIIPGSVDSIPATTSTGKPCTRRGFEVLPVDQGPLWDEVIGENGHRVSKKRGEQGSLRYWPKD